MSTIPELGAALQIPIREVIRMGEQQVLNPESTVFKSIQNGIIGKLAAVRAVNDSEVKKGGKSRVYIQHAVPATARYSLTSAFPQFDIRFNATDMRSGAVSIATATLVTEYMLNKFKLRQGRAVAYGVGLKQLVMRNRSWVHLCVAGHSPRVQNEFFADDRAIAAVTHSVVSKGKTGTLCQSYVAGQTRVHCTSAPTCVESARVGLMLLNKTDTNFRQVAMFMRQHSTDLLYFAIPGSKEMEMCVEGNIPELDALVFPSDGGERINVCYKNAPGEDMSYTYANYLELVARTTVTIDGYTYHKEFDNKLHGYLVYKVTRFAGKFHGPPPPYKSWIEPGYRNLYMVHVPVLKPGGNVHDPKHWSLVGVPVDRGIIDDVVDSAYRTDTSELVQAIEHRLLTRTSGYSMVHNVVTPGVGLPVHLFDAVAMAIYCTVFMRKFETGKTVTTLAPHARHMAKLASGSASVIAFHYAAMLLGNMVRASSIVTDKLRAIYYEQVADATLPLPSFALCPGFVEYSDSGSSNPRFNGWVDAEFASNVGFSSYLPGMTTDVTLSETVSVLSVGTTVDRDLVDAMICTGEAYVASDATLRVAEHDDVVKLACGLWDGVMGLFDAYPDVETLPEEPFQQSKMVVPGPVSEVVESSGGLFGEVRQRMNPKTYTPDVDRLVKRIGHDTGGLVEVAQEAPVQLSPMFVPEVPPIIPGPISVNPLDSVRSAILAIFPNSLVMHTEHFESDRSFGGWDALAKVTRAKLDISKISGVKPESFYRPLLAGHVQPNVKDTFDATFHSLNQRNFNSTKNDDPMDIDVLWSRSWQAMKEVFYVTDTEERLAAMPYIGPTDDSIRTWVSKLDEAKRKKLESSDEGYTFPELFAGATDTQLMVKKKLKPTLGASYATSVKHPQTIQFDATGKSVAVLSPMIAEKVKREQSVLRPNVLVMQGKSVDDVNKFLNAFDHRPDARGVRHYIEVDYSQYDKSQGRRLAEMYLRLLGKFGMLPEYVNFIRDSQHTRTVAAMKAGIKAWLSDQNMSGAPYTLDRNNGINEMVIAELLLEIKDKIEFIILMGDDILIAVRGDVNVAHWEVELSRKYNLTLKAATHTHGYICSMDVCHLPNGRTRVVADVVKRALAFMDQSVTDEEKLWERYVSYCDNLQGVQDIDVQRYLTAALPDRMQSYLPSTTSDAIANLLMAHAGMLRRSDEDTERYAVWRSFFAAERSVRFY